MSDGVVVAGGGLVAQRFCERLRGQGYEGRIRVVCEEGVAPYDRPPLSKHYLLGKTSDEQLALRPRGWHDEQQVELLLGRRAIGLDPATRSLQIDGGETLRYSQLLVATGSRPRRLEQAEGFGNVHYLRTATDARALRRALVPGSRLAVVGGGFIGLEVAATARKLGVHVTIVEALAAPLERIVGAQLGRWFVALHRGEGAEVLTGATITSFQGRGGEIERLELDDGTSVECDTVVIGVGIVPATGWLAESGLPADGIPVDTAGRTPVEHVYAAGDAARPFDPATGTNVRSEHWEAAVRQATAAANAILGLPAQAPSHAASFWSDQYGLRIQYLGHATGADRMEIDGSPGNRDFTATFHRDARPVAALLVGRPHALPAMRRLLASDSSADAQATNTAQKGGDQNADDTDALRAAG